MKSNSDSGRKVKGYAILDSFGAICVAYDAANQWTLFPTEKIARKILKETTIKFQGKEIRKVIIHILPPKEIKKN